MSVTGTIQKDSHVTDLGSWGRGGHESVFTCNEVPMLDLKEDKDLTYCIIIRSHQVSGGAGKSKLGS